MRWIVLMVAVSLLLPSGGLGQHTGLFLSLLETPIDNDGFVDVDSIGDSSNPDMPDNRLLCHTNETMCCGRNDPGPSTGVWLLPDGTAPPTSTSSDGRAGGFSRDRGPSVVRLYRRINAPERGRFRCELLGNTTYVNILDIGSVSITPSAPLTVTVGQAVTLQCSVDITTDPLPATSATPAFEWFFGQTFNQPLTPTTNTNSGSMYTSTYSIASTMESDGGMYTCRLRGNQLTARSTMVTVDPAPTTTPPPTPMVTASITDSGSNTAGETYSLVCSVTVIGSTIQPTITWSGPMNSPVPSGMVSTTGSMSTLTFNPLSAPSHDGRTYTCRATAGSLSGEDTFPVQVNVPEIKAMVTPSISSSLTLGQTGFSLTCDVSGTDNLNSPTLTYEWRRNGGVMPNQRERTLSLSPLSGSQVGVYVCMVTVDSTLLNSVEMRTSGTHTVSAQIPALTSVRVTSDQTNPLAVRPIDTAVTLTCTVELSPSVDVPVTVNTMWTGPARFMTTNTAQPVTGSTTTYTSTAMVSSFGRDQSGNYRCRATVSSTSQFIISSSELSPSVRVTVGTYLSHNGMVIQPNSTFLIADIGNTSSQSPLVCTTDRMPCCGDLNDGRWKFPDGTAITEQSSMFRIARLDNGNINLFRTGNDVISPTGGFCCEVQDAVNVNVMLCVHIAFISVSINASTVTPVAGEDLTLTCRVSGTTVETYKWWKNDNVLGSESGRTLSFTPLSVCDAARYTCGITFNGDMYNGTEVVFITMPAPESVVATTNPITTITSPITLTCMVNLGQLHNSGCPSVIVRTEWSGPAGFTANIIVMTDRTTSYQSSVMIGQLSRENSGNYSCAVTLLSPSNQFINNSDVSVSVVTVTYGIQLAPTIGPTTDVSERSTLASICSSEVGRAVAITVGVIVGIVCLIALPVVISVIALCWRKSRQPSNKSNDGQAAAAVLSGVGEGQVYEEPDKLVIAYHTQGDYELTECPAYATSQPHTQVQSSTNDYDNF